MRLTFTFLLLCAMVTMTFAQINADSPYPVDVEILSPPSAAGIYDYGTQSSNADNPIWGPTLSESVVGEVVWAYNAAGDSLGCETITTDLTGKIAMIRRGACGFSLKTYNAEQAGAAGVIIVNHYDNADDTGATIVNMLGIDSAQAVTIPAVFINRNTGEIIAPALDGPDPVTASFTVKSFFDPVVGFAIQTPLSEAVEFDAYQIRYVNPNAVDAVDVTATAVITAPSGAETTLMGTSNIAPLADSSIVMDGAFTPTELGEHTITWTNDQSAETLTSSFYTTDFTYAINDVDINSAPVNNQSFLDGGLIYQAGALSVMDSDGAITTHASFGLANGAEIFTGDVQADQINVVLYDADNDNDGFIDFSPTAQATTTFDELVPVAFATYIIDGTETIDNLLYVEWEDLEDGDNMVALKPDGAYYTVVTYDGTEAGLGVQPAFTGSTGVNYLNFPTTPIIIQGLFFDGGWNGNTLAIGLHLAGFVPTVGIEDIVSLDADKVTLAPNPVSSRMNVMFNLDATADEVQLILTDVSGKQVSYQQHDQVLNQSIEMDFERLPAGTYFLSIATPEGYRVERVIKQ